MQRFCYRAQYHDSAVLDFIPTKAEHIKELLRAGKIFTATVFSFDFENLFVYFECVDEPLTPLDLLPGIEPYLYTWPGTAEKRWFVPMVDVYHSIQPQGDEVEHWHRKVHASPRGQMSVMNMDKLSSYTFFHFQLQEEKVASNGKHMSIWSSEDVAILYAESPDEGLENPHKGILDTHNTPKGWAGVMRPHFNIRPDGEIYHAATVVLTLSEADL